MDSRDKIFTFRNGHRVEVPGTVKFKVSLPFFRSLLGDREYLLDGVFLKSLQVPARRALLIFPPSLNTKVSAFHRKIEPLYTPHDAYRALVDALDWVDVKRREKAFKTFKKFRFSFLFPMLFSPKWLGGLDEEGEVSDSELNWAKSLLEEILRESGGFKNFRCKGVEYVLLEGEAVGDEVVIEHPEAVARNYRWLLGTDAKFREMFKDLVLGSSKTALSSRLRENDGFSPL